MKIGEILSEYLTENGMSQRQFAKKCGMSNGYISMLIKNKNTHSDKPIVPSLSTLLSISKALGISLDQLLETADDIQIDISSEDISPTYPGIIYPKMRRVPLLGKVACGKPIYSPNYDDGYALINTDVIADFALETKGDSMTGAGITDGDVVFFVEAEQVDNGQIAAVFIDNEVTLKRVYYHPEQNKLLLAAENPKYPPMVYTGAELDGIRIIGRAVAYQHIIK